MSYKFPVPDTSVIPTRPSFLVFPDRIPLMMQHICVTCSGKVEGFDSEKPNCNNIGIKNIMISSSNQEKNNELKIPFGYKKYIPPCPECRSANSLVYNIFTDDWICKNCGYTIYGCYFDDEK